MKLLIITEQKSELSALLEKSFETADICKPGNLPGQEKLSTYDTFAVLGGCQEEPLKLWPQERLALESQLYRGARFFVEYTAGIDIYHSVGSGKTRYARPVLLDNDGLCTDFAVGTLFDEQSNDRLIPNALGRSRKPILQYVDNPKGFYCQPDTENLKTDENRFALWMEKSNLLICSFRMSQFASAKFAPLNVWGRLLRQMVVWLGGSCTAEDVTDMMKAAYRLEQKVNPPVKATQKALRWFTDADMLVEKDNAPYCVLEGLGTHVRPDGTHEIGRNCRPDCTGEASLAFYMHYLCKQDEKSLRIADGLRRFPADCRIKEGLYKGMVSWTPDSFFACYQDDVARGYLLPELWRAWLSGDYSALDSVKTALDYLLSTTGTDGLRMCRTDFLDPCKDRLTYMNVERDEQGKWSWGISPEPVTAKQLKNMPANCPSAHYNAFYLEALMLYGKLTGQEEYCRAGEKGMESLMAYYPETAREHSQTQELCRLIQPLAVLNWVTKDPEKKTWLYRVTEDLCKFKHPNGGFQEWDEGYIATCAGVKDGESSVLSENGDPVADMLYSVNWLPMGFAAAWLITKDPVFENLWQETADFFSRMQIVSENRLINGIWPRSVDLDAFEVYGVPNDVGWAPWSVESGWTVSEIAAGLLFGEWIRRHLDDEKMPVF